MKKSNLRGTTNTVTTKMNVQRSQSSIPNVGEKLFRRTSENSSDIH